MASIFRGPLFSSRPRARGPDLGWTQQNLLEGTLGLPVPGTPFAQTDWSNPTRTRRSQSGEITVAVNLLLTVLAVAVAAPFNQTDWPNPAARPPPRHEVSQNLLVTTLATPFAQLDWPNPAGRPPPRHEIPQNLLGYRFAPPGAVPFSESDWPAPPARKAQPTSDPPNLLGTTLAPSGQAPFAQLDWANPAGRAARQVGFAQSLLVTTLATPFAQADWAIPPRRAQAQADTWPNRLVLFPAPGAAPFAQNEWPNPTLRIARHDATFTRSLLATTLFVAPAGTPFTATDWPIPLRPRAGVPGTEERNEALLEATAAPATEAPSGGWFRKPKPRFPGETESERDARIKAERVRMGIIPPDALPLDATPPTPPSEGGARGGAINRHKAYSLTAHLLPEDLEGLEALAARAAQLTVDHEIAMWLRLAEQRRLHEEWLRDEDDAAVLMLAIATLH